MVSEWQDSKTGTLLGYATMFGDEDAEPLKVDTGCDDSVDGTGNEEDAEHVSEWTDPSTGVVLQYACDDDSDFGDHLEHKTPPKDALEWEDPSTGVILGYECDEDSDLGDHMDEEMTEDDEALSED